MSQEDHMSEVKQETRVRSDFLSQIPFENEQPANNSGMDKLFPFTSSSLDQNTNAPAQLILSEYETENLKTLSMMKGIRIKAENNEYQDSKELLQKMIQTGNINFSLFELAMIQLTYKYDQHQQEGRVALCNNLGCLYAWLGHYIHAQQYLQEARTDTVPGSVPHEEVTSNLEIINRVLSYRKLVRKLYGVIGESL
ncbi:MAG TPA: hypothetical protein VJ761_14915 [Ktedonobacteraceae bacterium]|nr:hypothetical protein [Ktedonobacteraceae bacterium]